MTTSLPHIHKIRAIAAAIIAMAAMLITHAAGAFTIDATTAAQLEAISKQMAADRMNEFILVQALKDNLMEEGKRYEFQYTPGHVKVNGEELRGTVADRYLKLLTDFFAQDEKTKHISFLSMRGDGVKLADVMNPDSKFRKPYASHRTVEPAKVEPLKGEELVKKEEIVKKAYYPNTIIIEMMQDGLTDTSHRVHISYTSKGLLVDEKPLSPAMDAKYKARFRELSSFTPTGATDGIDIISIPDNPRVIGMNNPAQEKGSLQNIRAAGSSELDNVRVFPLPATDFLTVEGAKGGQAVIMNTLGQQIANMSFQISDARQRLDIHTLPAGSYILQLTTAGGSKGAINITRQ